MRTKYSNRDIEALNFGDSRLETRQAKIISDLSENLSGTLPELSKNASATKALYRFFKNPQVTPAKIMHCHSSANPLSLKKHKRILHVMDTVEYDMTRKKGAKNLEPMNYLKRRGLYQHNSLLLTEHGAPLGLFKQSYIIRSDEYFGQADERRKLPFNQKESYRWYQHFIKAQLLCEQYTNLEVVSIADREADIMELFQARSHSNMHFVIRSKHNRKLSDGQQNLHPTLANSPLKGIYEAKVYDPKTKKKRKVTLEIRFQTVEIKLHNTLKTKRGLPAFKLNAVEVREINPPKNIEKPILWVLLTTLPVDNLEQALTVIKYYCLRWVIERFHFTLKTGGANLEELQLTDAHRIKNVMTTYSIAAMNVFKIRYWAEHEPMTSIYEIGITPIEHKVLYNYAQQQKHIQKKKELNTTFDEENPPTIKEFAIILGLIAGFIPSKRQPLPGIRIINRAVDKLNILVDAYLIFCQRTE